MFLVQPSSALVGQMISPAIQVEVQDAGAAGWDSNPITLVINANPGGATLSGAGPVNAVGGVATFNNVRLDKAGTGYTLTAFASGGAINPAPSGSFDIAPASTTTAIMSDSPDPSVVGQSFAVNYAVAVTAPASGTPTGTVTVSDGTNSCQASVAAGSCMLTSLAAGPKSVTATYAGDANFGGSTSGGASHTVNKANTTTQITSDVPEPSVIGQPITVSFDVNISSPGGGILGGTVTVSDGSATCGPVPVSAGSCQLTPISAGNKTLTANYSGTGDYNPSVDPSEPHVVNKAATTVTVTSDTPDPSIAGQAVAVNYSIGVTPPGVGTPTGNVVVTVGGSSDTCTGTVAAGTCSLIFTSSGANKTITATYTGDANFLGDADTEQHDVSAGSSPRPSPRPRRTRRWSASR